MLNKLLHLTAAASIAVVVAGHFAEATAAETLINSKGGGSGSERCLVGGADGKCSGGTYNGAQSMLSVFMKDLGAGHTFARVDDGFDKTWTNTVTNGGQVQALARYAGDNSRLGFDATAANGGYTQLTGTIPNNTVRVNNYSAFAGDTRPGDFAVMADLWTTIPVQAGTPFAFVLNDVSMNYKITSNPLSGVGASGYANSGQSLDYMVTFQVLFQGQATEHYFIAWEDRNPKLRNTGDYDYNDYIAEVRFANPVPEPEIYLMLGAGLGLMGFVARRRKRYAD